MSEPLVIACVKWSERYSAYYVNTLYDMVRRHMPRECNYTFHCFTDDAEGLYPEIIARTLPEGLTGWWNKVYVFKAGVFAPGQRIVYFDLDTLIVRPLDAIIAYRGEFALLRDFYRAGGYGSGVMLWRAGACDTIWETFEAAGRPDLEGGDQIWIERSYPGADLLQDCFPEAFASYKVDCHPLPPPQASVVCFHGEPKQDNCDAVWVRDVWQATAPPTLSPLTLQEELRATIQQAESVQRPWITQAEAHARTAVVIATGPSLALCIEELQREQESGHDLMAVNAASLWLAQQGIPCSMQAICTTQPITPQEGIACYYASLCPAAVCVTAPSNALFWHADVQEGMTAGLQAMHLAYLLGYRSFRLYGFDSCCSGKLHQLGVPPEMARDRVYPVTVEEKTFLATQWMVKQVTAFDRLMEKELLPAGCAITIHGKGLLRDLAVFQARKIASTDTP